MWCGVGICKLDAFVRFFLSTAVTANGEGGSTYERELLSEYPENELLFVTFAIIALVSWTNFVGWSAAQSMFWFKCMPRHNSRKEKVLRLNLRHLYTAFSQQALFDLA